MPSVRILKMESRPGLSAAFVLTFILVPKPWTRNNAIVDLCFNMQSTTYILYIFVSCPHHQNPSAILQDVYHIYDDNHSSNQAPTESLTTAGQSCDLTMAETSALLGEEVECLFATCSAVDGYEPGTESICSPAGSLDPFIEDEGYDSDSESSCESESSGDYSSIPEEPPSDPAEDNQWRDEDWGFKSAPTPKKRSWSDSTGSIIEPPKPEKLPSWSAPLQDFALIPEANRITAGGRTFEFLSAVLWKKREVDLPFLKRHELARYLLRCVEKSFFAWMQKWHPLHLILLDIREADDIELPWWSLIVGTLSTTTESRLNLPKEADILDTPSSIKYLEQIRHIAVHQLNYDTTIIRCVVAFVVQAGNFQLVSEMDQVLEALYSEARDDATYHLQLLFGEEPELLHPVPQTSKTAMDLALGIVPSAPTTPHEVLDKLAIILGQVCLDYSRGRSIRPEARRHLTESTETELHGFSGANGDFRPPMCIGCRGEFFVEYRDGCVDTRHTVEHRCRFGADLKAMDAHLTDAKKFAAALGDTVAIAEMEALEEYRPALKAKSNGYYKDLAARPEVELKEMRDLAKKHHEEWAFRDFQLECADYEDFVANSYKRTLRLFDGFLTKRRFQTLSENLAVAGLLERRGLS